MSKKRFKDENAIQGPLVADVSQVGGEFHDKIANPEIIPEYNVQ